MIWWLHQSADWKYSTNISGITAAARSYATAAHGQWMRDWKGWARALDLEAVPTDQRQAIQTMAAGVVFTNEKDTRYYSPFLISA